MKRTLVIIALSACIPLGGCGTKNRGMESVHQPVVARTDYVYDMAADGDTRGLAAWFDSLNLRYGDHVSVDSQGYGGSAAHEAVAAVAARYGLLIDETAPITEGAIPAGSVRVIVSRMSASVPNCPDFSRQASPNFNGDGYSNYGCASNTNLAAMIADPRDLIAGRASGSTSDATLGSKAIRTYRRAANTGSQGLKNESTKGN